MILLNLIQELQLVSAVDLSVQFIGARFVTHDPLSLYRRVYPRRIVQLSTLMKRRGVSLRSGNTSIAISAWCVQQQSRMLWMGGVTQLV